MQLAQRIAHLHASPIREILAVAARPGMISFAGGLPAADSFPTYSGLDVPPSVLQYGPSEGEPALRRSIAEELRSIGLDCTAEQVLILSGSQQGIDLVAKLFVDTGTPVAVESPTYLAALQVFRLFGARLVPLMAPGARLAYAIPTFQNPTGHCYSTAERDALAAACDAEARPLFEDDPYRELVYTTCDRTPVCARLRRAPWIYQGSFSKTLAPGLRLGYLAAAPELMAPLIRLKQAADLHSNRLSQWLVADYLAAPDRQERLDRLRQRYRQKRDHFAAALTRHFDDLAEWQLPPGGLFFWLRLRRPFDTRTLLAPALAAGVAFMPGENFFADPDDHPGYLRLNFSAAADEDVDRGLGQLAALIRQWQQSAAPARRHP